MQQAKPRPISRRRFLTGAGAFVGAVTAAGLVGCRTDSSSSLLEGHPVPVTVDQNLAAVSAATADVDDFGRVAGLQDEPFRIRPADDLQRFGKRNFPSQTVSKIIFSRPPEDQTGLHQLVTAALQQLVLPAADAGGNGEFFLIFHQ